jgi:beta-lactamase class A
MSLIPQASELDAVCRKVVSAAAARYSVKLENLAISVARLEGRPEYGGYRQDTLFYPASVVKVFYLAYAGVQITANKLKETPELHRGLTDMIVESSNDATNWILEVLTGASGGSELSPSELRKWQTKRQAINRYFQPKGYPGLNASQKTWDWGPYGRERQGYGPNFELRNAMSPAHAVRLFSQLANGELPRSEWSLTFLSRTIPADDPKATAQARNYIGAALPSGSKLWSKAGWTSTVRHDAALIELPNGHRYAIALFSQNSNEIDALIPSMARDLLEALGEPVRRE